MLCNPILHIDVSEAWRYFCIFSINLYSRKALLVEISIWRSTLSPEAVLPFLPINHAGVPGASYVVVGVCESTSNYLLALVLTVSFHGNGLALVEDVSTCVYSMLTFLFSKRFREIDISCLDQF